METGLWSAGLWPAPGAAGTAALHILKADGKRCRKGRTFPLTRRLRGHHDFRRVTWG